MKNKPGSVVWILVGVFLLVMGLYFLINPKATLTSIAWLFGLTMLVSGIADLVLYAARQWAYGASVWFYADGIIDVLIGIAFLCNDWLAAELLPYILAVWAVISGITKVMGAVLYRRQGMPFDQPLIRKNPGFVDLLFPILLLAFKQDLIICFFIRNGFDLTCIHHGKKLIIADLDHPPLRQHRHQQPVEQHQHQ